MITEFLLDRSPSPDKHFVYRDFDLEIFNLNFEFSEKGVESKYKNQGRLDYFLSGFQRKAFYQEEHFNFNRKVFELKTDTYFQGFWQSYKYFEKITPEIKTKFNLEIIDRSVELFNEVNRCSSVCINVRRGDFLLNPFHGHLEMEYFNKAIDIISSRVSNPSFYIFSDDIEWCTNNFSLDYPFKIITHDHKGKKFGNYLKLMSSCKHFIIPNSSFAWWSAWLSPHYEPMVIAPLNWFNDQKYNDETIDLIPDNWIRL